MGKGSSKEVTWIGEKGGSAWQRCCQEASDALSQGDLEHVAELLSKAETDHLRPDQSYVIGAAHQICLACLQAKADLTWHRQAERDVDQRVQEFQRQLALILNLIGQFDSAQELPLAEHTLSPPRIPLPSESPHPAERQKKGRFWEHVRAFLGTAQPSTVDGKITRAAGVTPAPETPLSLPGVEQTTSLASGSGIKIEPGSPSLVIYCLGPFRVYQGEKEIAEWHSFKGRDILKYLLARRGTPVAKDILIDVFWPDADPRAARRNLHQTIYSLRQTLRGEQPEFPYIWFENDCYFLNPQMDVWLDFIEFEKCVQAGRRLEKIGHMEEAIDQYGTAEGLYQGDFLEEDLYEDWPAIQREQLLSAYLSIVERLCELYFKNRQYAAVVPLCQKVLTKDRSYEAAHRWLMQCYLAFGQRHLAVRQYQTCVQALKEELDILPSEETVALYQRMISKGRV